MKLLYLLYQQRSLLLSLLQAHLLKTPWRPCLSFFRDTCLQYNIYTGKRVGKSMLQIIRLNWVFFTNLSSFFYNFSTPVSTKYQKFPGKVKSCLGKSNRPFFTVEGFWGLLFSGKPTMGRENKNRFINRENLSSMKTPDRLYMVSETEILIYNKMFCALL